MRTKLTVPDFTLNLQLSFPVSRVGAKRGTMIFVTSILGFFCCFHPYDSTKLTYLCTRCTKRAKRTKHHVDVLCASIVSSCYSILWMLSRAGAELEGSVIYADRAPNRYDPTHRLINL